MKPVPIQLGRGNKAKTNPPSSRRSDMAALAEDDDDRVVKSVPAPPRRPFARELLFRPANGLPDLDALKEHLSREGRLAPDDAIELVRRAGALFRQEPNLLRLADPITGT